MKRSWILVSVIIFSMIGLIVLSEKPGKSLLADPVYYFLPQQKDSVMQLQHDMITSAKRNVDVAMYGLTQAPNNSYADDLIGICKKGITLRLLRDQLQSDSKASTAANDAISAFKNCEVRVKNVAAPIMHSKVTIVDGTRVFWGSLNESKSSPTETNIVEFNSDGAEFEKAFEVWWKSSITWADFKKKKG